MKGNLQNAGIVVFFVLTSLQSYSQNPDSFKQKPGSELKQKTDSSKQALDISKFETLKINSSPAFVILGVDPENIQRPSSPTQFIGGIQNAIINGKLKPNLAFELSPYYWKNPKTDSLRFDPKEYILPEKNAFRNIWKTMSISLGTSESDTVVFGKLNPGTGVGTGLRFTIIDGRPRGENMNRLLEWSRLVHKQAILLDVAGIIRSKDNDVTNKTIIQNVIDNYLQNISNKKSIYNLGGLYGKKEFIKSIQNEIQKSSLLKDEEFIDALAKIIEDTKKEEEHLLNLINKTKYPFAKTGFILEFSAGSAFVFQNNSWDNIKHAKTSLWLTPSYRWQLNKDTQTVSLLDVIGVLRYSINNKKDSVDIANYFDAGLKLQYTHNQWSLSIEGIYRNASKTPINTSKNYTYRLATSINYKLTDAITFQFSFGTNFDGNTATYTEPKKLFAVGGLNLGLFSAKK